MAKTVFSYPGGKTYMAEWVISHFPEHTGYVEVFGGGASVLVNKPPSTNEVYNDKDSDLVHFFRVLREQPYELIRWIKQHPYHKDLHEKFSKGYYNGYRPDDDIERAGRFFYLRKSQFSAKYNGYSGFGSSARRNKATTLRKAAEELATFSERFRNVVIENRDWRTIFDRFDKPNTLFYCDPPYVEEGDDLYTNEGFDHLEFVNRLHDVDGYFVLSYTDLPNGLSDFHTVEREQQQHMRRGQDGRNSTTRTERLVMNFNPNTTPMFSATNQTTTTDWIE